MKMYFIIQHSTQNRRPVTCKALMKDCGEHDFLALCPSGAIWEESDAHAWTELTTHGNKRLHV